MRRVSMERKDKRYLIGCCALFLTAAALQFAAREIPGFATWYAHHVYPVFVGTAGRLSGCFPFSLSEAGLYLLLAAGVYFAVRQYKKWKRLVIGIACLCGGLLFLYTANCGVNYYAASFSDYTGLETGLYTKEELQTLCQYLTQQINVCAEEGSQARYGENRQLWRREGVRAMQRLAESGGEKRQDLSCLGGYYPLPKEWMISRILSVQQLCGIYLPFFVEATFNGEMPDYNIPHTICHELSHLKGFMREDEANFIGYLACVSSENPGFRYSGYLTGWVYVGNALADADVEAYLELQKQLDPRAAEDLQENSVFWNHFDGAVAEASNRFNDTYLKMNSQEDGVKSYGRMVDLMLAYYKDSGR